MWINTELWRTGKGDVAWWVQIHPVLGWWRRQGKKSGGLSDAPVTGAHQAGLWWFYDLGLFLLVWVENEVSWSAYLFFFSF